MKRLVIMRGLPGSGKSTHAKELQGGVPTRVICSADDYFMKDGIYQFDPKQLGKAHEACKAKAHTAMLKSMSVVIIDNTNMQKWEFQDYIAFGMMYGYKIEKIVCGNLIDIKLYAERNTHGVPFESIKRMAERFEP